MLPLPFRLREKGEKTTANTPPPKRRRMLPITTLQFAQTKALCVVQKGDSLADLLPRVRTMGDIIVQHHHYDKEKEMGSVRVYAAGLFRGKCPPTRLWDRLWCRSRRRHT